jgi:hypothetical protein
MPASPAAAATSPGKAQLQAVRALDKQQQAQQPAQQQQQEGPDGTPGYSESSSVGRAVNAQIASSIAGMFMATPPQPPGFCSDDSGSGGSSRPHGTAQSVGAAAGHAADAGGGGRADGGWVSPEPAQHFTLSPGGFGGLPAPPEQPDRLQTAMSDSVSLEPQVGRWGAGRRGL